LRIDNEEGFHPKLGESYPIVEAESRSGAFNSVEEASGSIGDGLLYLIQYDTTGAELVVAKASPTTLTTALSGEGKQGVSVTVKEGTPVRDSASLSGFSASSASGSVTYALYSDSTCTTQVASAGVGEVSDGVVGVSEAETLAPGTYYWQASYSGDRFNEPSISTCGSEVETVEGSGPTTVALAQPAAASQVGASFSLTATVTEAGVPRANVSVTFTVTGANSQVGSSTTNEAGQATFTYKGEHAGTDHIVASFLDKAGQTVISNEATETWTTPQQPPPPPSPTPKNKVLSSQTRLPAPVLGRTVNAEVVSGVVFVKLPTGAPLSLAGPLSTAFESLSKGLGFVPLSEARQIPVGSILETTHGVVKLTTATATAGKVQFGDFGAGIFKLLQNRKQRGLTELDIIDLRSPQQVCATLGKRASVAGRHLPSTVLGRLNSTDHGKFTARGQYSAATVRGTVYSVTNECAGTLTQVSRGEVSVRDFVRRKTITLFAGQHYLAKAP
jgi:hypothetical protein